MPCTVESIRVHQTAHKGRETEMSNDMDVLAELDTVPLFDKSYYISQQRQRRMVEAQAQILQKVDRIISEGKVRVVLNDGPARINGVEASAHTDGRDVYLSKADMIRDLDETTLRNAIMRTTGRNYHELSHILFTPRQDSEIIKWLTHEYRAPGVFLDDDERWRKFLPKAWNSLEDQRIETLFTTLYAPSAPYFRAAILRVVVNNTNPDAFKSSHGLLHGRKYISARTRAMAERAFAATYGQRLADRITEVVNTYLRVKYPQNQLLAQTCLREMAEILAAMMPDEPTNETAEAPVKGQIVKRTQDEAVDELGDPSQYDDYESEIEASDEPGDQSGESGDETTESDDAESDGEAEATDAGDDEGSNGSGDQDDDDADGDGDGDGDGRTDDDPEIESGSDDPHGGSSESSGPPNEPEDRDLRDQIEDELDETLDDDDFNEELADHAGAIVQTANGQIDSVFAPNARHSRMLPPVEAVVASRRMSAELQRLKAEMEEEWLRRQGAGQLDMSRLAHRMPWQTDIFRQYEPGEYDDAKVEAVVLCDLSYSMMGVMTELSVALWVLMRSLQSIESRVTVIGFSDNAMAMYQPLDRVPGNEVTVFNYVSGTNPDQAIEHAYSIFAGSDFNRKMMISLTDGDWQGDDDLQRSLMSAIREFGVESCLVEFNTGYTLPHVPHGHEHMVELKSLADLPRLGAAMVDGLLRKNLA